MINNIRFEAARFLKSKRVKQAFRDKYANM
jgi:hypothetical protein